MTEMTKEELLREIEKLPVGYISKKKINGGEYFYRQWVENGKVKSKYVKKKEIEELEAQIEKRKKLQEKLKKLEERTGKRIETTTLLKDKYYTNVVTGRFLSAMVEGVTTLEKRECFLKLWSYIEDENDERFCLVCGDRRTGKSTLIRQALSNMSDAMIAKTAYVRMTKKDTLTDLNADIRAMEENGIKYVFVDEAMVLQTISNFGAFVSDLYCAAGMKIVFSGAVDVKKDDSMLSIDNSDAAKIKLITTTYVSYKEFCKLMNTDSINDYITYGGSLRSHETGFLSDDKTSIQNLAFLKHVIAISDFVKKDELLAKVDEKIEEISKAKIANDNLQDVDMELTLLDKLCENKVYDLDGNRIETYMLTTQPGQRLMYVNKFIDNNFSNQPVDVRKTIKANVFHRMLVDTILLDMKRNNKTDKQVSLLQFAEDEYDILLVDENKSTCDIYAVRDGQQISLQQCIHLIDTNKCQRLEKIFGTIASRNVIYKGENTMIGQSISFENVDKLLRE